MTEEWTYFGRTKEEEEVRKERLKTDEDRLNEWIHKKILED